MIVLGTPLRQAPLSRAQAAILLAQLRAPCSSAYHEPLVITIDGLLDVPALRQAARNLLLRHEILRTSYQRPGGVAAQVVHELAGFELPLAAEESWDDLVTRPFDLTAEPPLRLALRQAAADRYELLVVRHHVATDGWSLSILLRDLAAGYAAARGDRPTLAPLARQYADVAIEERSDDGVQAAERDLEWWSPQLAGKHLGVELPGPTGAAACPGAHGLQLTIPVGVVQRLRAMIRASTGTEFGWLLTAVAATLGRWLPDGPVPVGIAVAGRDDPAVADLVGCFSSVLPVLVNIDPGRPVLDVVARAGERVAGALSHARVDPSLLAAQFGTPSVVVAYQSLPDTGDVAMAGLVVGLRSLQPPDVKSDLSITVTPQRSGEWRLQVRSGRAAIADEVCDHIAVGVASLLQELTADPGRPLANAIPPGPDAPLPVLPAGSRPGVPASTLGRAVGAWAATVPDRVAVSSGSTQVSYLSLLQRAVRLASAIGGRVPPETPVICWLAPGPDLVTAELAVLLCGGSFVPQDRRTPWSVVAGIRRRTAAPVVLTDGPVPGLLPADVAVVDVRHSLTAHTRRTAQTRLRLPAQHPDQTGYLIFTSGSTGEPKGVQVPQRAVLELVEGTGELLAAAPCPRRWSCLHSPAFDFSIWEIWAPLVRGEQIVFITTETSADPRRLAARLDRERVDVLSLTPAAFSRLSAQPGDWHRPGTVVLGGDAYRPGQSGDWLAQGGRRVVNMLGITEITVHGTAQLLAGPWRGSAATSPVGALLPYRDGRVVDRFGRTAPALAVGELLFSGSGLARGYLGRPDLTAAGFVPAWWGPPGGRAYRSGDLVAHLAGVGLDYRHRRDQQLSLHGQRIEPGQVEAALLADRSVGDAVVAVAGHGDGAFLAAWLVAGDTVPDLARLRRRLTQRLPAYLVPSAFVLIDELPTTPHGKLDPARLPPVAIGDGISGGAEPPGPASALEARLVGLWSEITGSSGTGLDDRFADLGAHSLIMLRLADAVERVYGIEFGLADLYAIATLRELAAEVEDRAAADGGHPVDLEALVETLSRQTDGPE